MAWAIDLKPVEKESFLKSFLLFFLSMGLMIVVITYINYKNELEHFDKALLNKMQLCNYSLNCKEFQVSFVPKKTQATYTLIKNHTEIMSFYPIDGGDDFYLKLFYAQSNYHNAIHFLHQNAFMSLALWLFVIIILSVLFSLYSLYPLRNALVLTREFVKDILHDFNTPIATMRLNLSLLTREIGKNKKLQRLERSIENILFLQENLRDYLHSTQSEKSSFNLYQLIQERVQLLENNYTHLNYTIQIPKKYIFKSEKQFFTRIIDNLLSNASKYNKPQGSVTISFDISSQILSISDTGKGIKNPQRAFERFYKEHERGMGIGLHIVKKLCDELKIKITLQSSPSQGTCVKLFLQERVISK